MKKLIVPCLIVALALFLLFAIRGHWDSWRSSSTRQVTSDAFVSSNQIPLSTRITGTVRKVNIGDYQAVKAGQLLLELDNTDYEASADEAAAAIDAAKAQLAANQNAKRAGDAVIEVARQAVEQARASVDSAQSAIVGQQAQLTRATAEYERQSKLLGVRATTHQEYEQALESRDTSEATLLARRADLSRANAVVASGLASLSSDQQQRAELNASDKALAAQVAAKVAALAVAKFNLGYTKIYAPADGQVGKLDVHPGQLLSAGMQVVEFIQSGPWIEANYQETQLTHVAIGDVAEIRIDALPGRSFRAYVSDIAPASGAATALLPPDNATGNFTKVVQRIPVKLRFDQGVDATSLRPGLSAQVIIHTDQIIHDTQQQDAARN